MLHDFFNQMFKKPHTCLVQKLKRVTRRYRLQYCSEQLWSKKQLHCST